MPKLNITPTTGGSNPTDLESDYYHAVVQSADVVTIAANPQRKYHQGEHEELSVVLLLDDGSQDGVEYTLNFQISLHVKSNMFKFVMALGIEDPDMMDDTDTWIGRELRLKIERYEPQPGVFATKCDGYAPIRRVSPPMADIKANGSKRTAVPAGVREYEDSDIPF